MPSPLVLHAWICDEYVGRFEKSSLSNRPTFEYSPEASRDLSVSLPRGEQQDSLAAQNFIDALVPEVQAHREMLRRVTGSESADPWDLAATIGGDMAGGVTLSRDEFQPGETTPLMNAASVGELAARILSTKNSGSSFVDFSGPLRFSLAGAQSKFAIAEMDGEYFWPDHATPSTHILKPESSEHRGLELIEAAAMDLAGRAGVCAAPAHVFRAADETSYTAERFDRERLPDGRVRRIHAEDLTQVLGVAVSDKYLVHSDEVVEVLRRATGNDELGYAFFRQYAFNSIVGNADAHGKNYTVLHRDSGLELSPLYDVLPIGMFPEYQQALAMPVSGMDHYLTIRREHWAESAQEAGLDADRVLDIVEEVSAGVLENLAATLGAVDHPRVSREELDNIRRSAEQQVSPGRSSVSARQT